jgi:outer membrane lipoprotein-sorting protein
MERARYWCPPPARNEQAVNLSAGRKKLLIGIFLVLAVPLPSLAQQEPDGQQLIDDFVNNVRTMSGRFEQQLIDADDIVVDKSSGTIEIQKPGRFRWTYLEPYEQILVADGLNVFARRFAKRAGGLRVH